jgi:hypothetical protein
MLDALITTEIQALRLELCQFANRQSDQNVQSRCHAIVAMLGKAVERDDPAVRADLANSVAPTRYTPCDRLLQFSQPRPLNDRGC